MAPAVVTCPKLAKRTRDTGISRRTELNRWKIHL